MNTPGNNDWHTGSKTLCVRRHPLKILRMNTLCAIAYASTAVQTLSEEETESMLFGARNFNSDADVTGALLQHERTFFQYFEGPQDSVDRVYERIKESSLHKDIVELLNAPIKHRVFADWYMGFGQATGSLILQLEQARWLKEAELQDPTRSQSAGLDLLLDFWNRGPGKA